jgi:hypothetical protein
MCHVSTSGAAQPEVQGHNHVLGRHVRAAKAPGVVPRRMLQELRHRHRLHPSVGVQPLIVTTTTAQCPCQPIAIRRDKVLDCLKCCATLKRPDPLGLKCDTNTSPRRLVNTFLTSNSTEFI